MVKRLTRLPPKEKAQIVEGQILPTLLYGSELHDTAWEEAERLLNEMVRCIVGAYRGSSIERLKRRTGIEETILVKKVRWAASVYGRDIPIMRKRAEEILKEHVEGRRIWMVPEKAKVTGVVVMEDTEGAIFSDGSRREGHTTAATTRDS